MSFFLCHWSAGGRPKVVVLVLDCFLLMFLKILRTTFGQATSCTVPPIFRTLSVLLFARSLCFTNHGSAQL